MEPSSIGPPPDIEPSELDERTRNRILRAAVDVFDRKGYAAASVREIVEKAGVTKPALYYHFGSKEGVLLAILSAAMGEFRAVLAGAASRPGDARSRLIGLCEEVYRLFSRHMSVVRVAHAASYAAREGGPAVDLNTPNTEIGTVIQRIVDEGVRRGEFRQVRSDDLGLLILGVIGESIHRELHGELVVGADGMRRAMELVFEGVLAKDAGETCAPRLAGVLATDARPACEQQQGGLESAATETSGEDR